MSDHLVVKPLERQSVVHLAVEQLRRMVATGTLAPGRRLPSERELAELFGVSRPTIREAIRVLGFAGILETKHGSGTYVTQSAGTLPDLQLALNVSSDAHDDLMEVRLWLEVGACERAAAHVTDRQIERLRRLLSEFELGPQDPESFVRQEVGFHATLHEASQNAVLISQMRVMGKLIEDRLRVAVETFGVRQASLEEHHTIILAMEARDPIAARRSMRQHLILARDELHRLLEAGTSSTSP